MGIPVALVRYRGGPIRSVSYIRIFNFVLLMSTILEIFTSSTDVSTTKKVSVFDRPCDPRQQKVRPRKAREGPRGEGEAAKRPATGFGGQRIRSRKSFWVDIG